MTQESSNKPAEQGSFLSTMGWIGAVALLAIVALVVLSWVGPVGSGGR